MHTLQFVRPGVYRVVKRETEMDAIMKASINHNDREGVRVQLECRREGEGAFCWYAMDDEGGWYSTGADGRINSHNPADIARSVWGSREWELAIA